MTAKLNNKSVVKSVELVAREDPKPVDEKWASMIVKPHNWTEDSGFYNVYGWSETIHNHFDWLEKILSGSLYQFNDNVWLYTETTSKATQKKVGIINVSDPLIMDAMEKNKETIPYSIPDLGVTQISLKKLYKVTVYARMEQVFNVAYLLPMDKGDAESCVNMIRSFNAGNRINFDVRIRFSEQHGSFHRSVHDRAGDLKKMIEDPNFNWNAFREEKKQEFLDIAKKTKKANAGETAGAMYKVNPEKVSLANVVAFVNGKQMHYMEVPEGEYKQVNSKGGELKAVVRIYSNASRSSLSDMAIQEKTKDTEPRVVRLVTR